MMRDDVADVRGGQPGWSVDERNDFSPWRLSRIFDDDEGKSVALLRSGERGPARAVTVVEEVLRGECDQVSQDVAASLVTVR